MSAPPKIIEVRIALDAVDPADAVLPSEKEGPTELLIVPIRREDRLDFRVAFEPRNSSRRIQPFRNVVAPTFPGEWRIGDSFEPDEHDSIYRLDNSSPPDRD